MPCCPCRLIAVQVQQDRPRGLVDDYGGRPLAAHVHEGHQEVQQRERDRPILQAGQHRHHRTRGRVVSKRAG